MDMITMMTIYFNISWVSWLFLFVKVFGIVFFFNFFVFLVLDVFVSWYAGV